MDDTNPFETPAMLPKSESKSKRTPLSTVVCAIVGGAVGLGLGVVGAIAVLFFAPGMPGVAEILILVVVISVFLVVPGVAIGETIGALLNRRK